MANSQESGGVNAKADGDVNVGGDAVGQDKVENTSSVINTQQTVTRNEGGAVARYAVIGVVVVAVVAIVVNSISVQAPAPQNATSVLQSIASLTQAIASKVPVTVTPDATPIVKSSESPTGASIPLSGMPTTTPVAINSASPTPQSQPTTILPVSTTIGVLSIKTLEECGTTNFEIKIGDQAIGSGKTDKKEYLLEGAYVVVLKGDFGRDLVKDGVNVKKGQETIVDFSQEMGALLVRSYAKLENTIPYGVYNNDSYSRGNLYSNSFNCGSPGKYVVNFSPTVPNYSGYGSTTFAVGFFTASDIRFDVEIRAGETTTIEPDEWPRQMGIMAFKAKNTTSLTAQIYQLQNGTQTKIGNEVPLASSEEYWLLAGVYNIVIIKPYAELVFENVEIKPGEKAVLTLPEP